MKLDILAITAHPDDVELSCSGTLLKHIQAGRKVGLVELTAGELGTRGTPQIRAKEAAAAAKKMGALVRDNLGLPDGLFTHSPDNLRAVASAIRTYQPEIVVANAIRDRHPDHGKGARLVHEAAFLAGLRRIETTNPDGSEQMAWRPRVVYHMIQDHHIEPDFVVDISEQLEEKMELILTFRSQFYDPNSSDPSTPISGADFLEFIRARARMMGRPAGFEYAEGFTCARYIGVRDFFDLV